MKLKAAAILAITLGAMGAEASASAGVPPTKCRPQAATRLVGRAVPSDVTIRRRTGSATVSRIAPGDVVTQDYREDRVTVTVFKGKVTAASCG
ncbi:I78 family peptidase inhibitor [Sphingomonas immobilis]|uniref:I78 family peptidase inhibitor n=1 Tax=Sphingomonas immobilis TaxID=3063997 RepID=A0ABT8ZWA5_9SPHN|nr:I78 family peptidase inhibitor [Sphingomonas sp. CA1-15]MDO7841855.1 I78 family peptidase inhibitor [Sphingomonas sp. CA1-15]